MKNHSPHLFLFCAAFALTLGSSLPAHADEKAAVEHANAARVAYDLQDWDKAIAEYRAAYTAAQKPAYLWALAQAQRMNGDWKGAIASYKAFKRLDVTTSQANTAEVQIATCEAELAKAEAKAAMQAQRQSEQHKAPKPSASPKAAPAAPKKTEKREPPPKGHAWYADPLGHVLFFSGLAVAGAGGYFLVTGNGDVGDNSGSYDEVTERQDSGKKKQVIGAGGLVVGGALAAGGVVRYLMVGNGGPAEGDRGVALGVTVLPGQASVACAGRF